MSLFAVNSLDQGVRGIHSPGRIEVHKLTPDYDRRRPRRWEAFEEGQVVAIVEQGHDGRVTIHVAEDVEVATRRLRPSMFTPRDAS